jgi:hypothetical protein
MSDRPLRFARLRDPGPILAFAVSTAVGLSVGLIDANTSRRGISLDLFHLSVCVLIGAWAAGWAWVCWLPLGSGVYLVHLVAIARGYRPPFVEESAVAARITLQFLAPAAIGLGFGVAIRCAFSAKGVLRRADGSPVRILPRTVRSVLATVAGFALAFRLLSWVFFDSSTLYSPGYRESSFQRVRVGATAAEVEGLLGPPLGRCPRADGPEVWAYTDGATTTSNYWRRWIVLEDGKVTNIVSDFWWD